MQNKEEQKINSLQDFREFAIKLLKERTKRKRVDVWRDLIKENLDWIEEQIQNGITKKEIYEVMSKYIRQKYGKGYLITSNYFYVLLKEIREETKSNSKSVKDKSKTNTEETKDRPDKKIGLGLEEHNEGGIL